MKRDITSFHTKPRKPLKRTPLRAKSALKPKLRVAVAKQAKKAPKKSKTSTAKLKKMLDSLFSKYIRRINPSECYTCGKKEYREKLQCGHFIPRQYLATRWKEENCKSQCVGCNIFGNGKPLDFEERLKKQYGEEFIEKMKASRHQIIKLDRNWYEEQIEKYRKLI